MSMPLESIEVEALKLTPEDRVALAERLLASIGDSADEALLVEVLRRDAEIDAGTAGLVPAEEAIASARRAIA